MIETISISEFRSKGREVVKRLDRGERLALTYRGRQVALLEPVREDRKGLIPADDPIHKFHRLAEPLGPMSNEDIDQLLYGEGSRFS
jgi:antitoxin (DNA-binding transcriptional repressor) of toxin-antitoxin stability system